MKKARLVLLREKISWQGEHSGYDVLCRHLGEPFHSVYRTRLAETGLPRRAANRLALWARYSPKYDASSAAAELRAIWRAAAGGSRIVHVMYAERGLGLLARMKRVLPAKVVATVHQPVSWWLERPGALAALSRIDGVFALTREAAAFFEKRMPGRAHLAPHGADTEFFAPAEGEDRRGGVRRCVFAGYWLRDFEALESVARLVRAREPGVRFDVVAPTFAAADPALARLLREPGVEFHSGVPDAALREIYRRSDVLVLPLRDTTATNTLVEALACGVPAVVTDVGGVREYSDASCADYAAPGDVESFARAVCARLASGEDEARKRRAAARAYALSRLSWKTAASKTGEIYDRLCA